MNDVRKYFFIISPFAESMALQYRNELNQMSLTNFQSKKGGKDQESIQSSITPEPGYHMGK